jgi:sporulation integral membrane protein YtvI
MILLTIYLLLVYVLPLFMKILFYLPGVFMPFIFAVLLALIIEPIVNLFQRYARFKRIWAVLSSLILVTGGFLVAVFMVVTVIIREISSLYRLAASHSDQIIGQIMNSLSGFQLFYLQLNLPPQVQAAIENNLQNGLGFLEQLMNSSVNGLMQAFIKLPSILILMTISAVATFFIIKDRALLRTFVMDFLPVSTREQTSQVINDITKALGGVIRAYSILISITAVTAMISLTILRVEYALTLGLLIGIMDIMPILGPGAIMVPWTIWEFMNHHTAMGISLLVVYIIISVTRQFLEPKIVGDSIGLHPLATLISLYVGLKLAGAAGMIMGPVLVVIFIACYRAGLLERWDWRIKT